MKSRNSWRNATNRRATGCSRTYVADGLGQPGQLAQLGDVVRVLHEPDVEHEVRLEGDAELVAEADELDDELVLLDVILEVAEERLAQLAQRQVGGVEDDVGIRPHRLEQAPLLGDRAGDPALVAERMAMARLRVAPDEDLVAGLEVEDLGPDPPALERAAHPGEGERRVARPDVEDDRDLRA